MLTRSKLLLWLFAVCSQQQHDEPPFYVESLPWQQPAARRTVFLLSAFPFSRWAAYAGQRLSKNIRPRSRPLSGDWLQEPRPLLGLEFGLELIERGRIAVVLSESLWSACTCHRLSLRACRDAAGERATVISKFETRQWCARCMTKCFYFSYSCTT